MRKDVHVISGPSIFRLAIILFLFVAVFPASKARAALQPDDILLVVNVRIPASRSLAEMYAKLRHIPDGRIAEIDVPPVGIANPPEEIAFDDYQRRVAQPVRDFIVRSGLQQKIKCVVTFWGVPLRIGGRKLTAAESEEQASLKKELDQDQELVGIQTAGLEKLAQELDPKFKPAQGFLFPQLSARLQAATTSAGRSLVSLPDPKLRDAKYAQFVSIMTSLLGTGRATEMVAQPALAQVVSNPPAPAEVATAVRDLARAEKEMDEVQGYAPDAAARLKVRELAGKSLGSFGKVSVVLSQFDSFRTEETEAALDSELSLLWWHAYPHARWLNNPLHWRNALHPTAPSLPTLMVTRLDGPSEMTVRELMKTSLEVEQKGLHGDVVLDARGKPATDTYGTYDQTLRNLNKLLHDHTALTVKFDDQDALIPPHSIREPIAIYCGWYSLRNYAPPGPFSPGAVGFHVASFELVSLRAKGEHGWVRGLLSDGVCGTIGPVAEPYLHSFPVADEFFPLLLTGKMTLAEVYWRTTPMVSWMQSCIGDPFYTPYLQDPALNVDDLPGELKKLFAGNSQPAASQPVR